MLSQNESGNTALHWASLNGHLEAVQILVKRFDEIEAEKKGTGAVQPANGISEADEDTEAQKRSIWDVVNQAGMGPMSTAQVNGRDKVVSFLLEHMIHGASKMADGQEDGERIPAEASRPNGHDSTLEDQTKELNISQST